MPERLEATVRRGRFHNRETGFTVLIGRRDAPYEGVTIVGSFPLGEWREDRRYGRQFVAESLSPVIPTSRDGIQRYFAAGHVKGVGATLAARMLDRFGVDLMSVRGAFASAPIVARKDASVTPEGAFSIA